MFDKSFFITFYEISKIPLRERTDIESALFCKIGDYIYNSPSVLQKYRNFEVFL